MASKQEKLNEIKKFLVSESGKNLTWTKEGGKKVYEGQQSIVYTTVKKIGLNNLTDSQINKFYDYVIGNKLYPKDVLETSEKAAAASPSGEGTLAGP